MAALDAALAFAEVHQAAVLVAQDLDLHVARSFHVALQEDAVVAEARHGFALCRLQLLVEVACGFDHAHAAAAAARAGLDQQREADARRVVAQRGRRLVGGVVAVEHRHAVLGGERLGARLVAEGAHCRGWWADPHQAGLLDRLGELGVLGQEAVTRVNRPRVRHPGGLEQCACAQITLGRRRRPNPHSLIGVRHVNRLRVRVRIHRHRPHPHPPARAENAHGNLTPIGDENALQRRCHGRMLAPADTRNARSFRSFRDHTDCPMERSSGTPGRD